MIMYRYRHQVKTLRETNAGGTLNYRFLLVQLNSNVHYVSFSNVPFFITIVGRYVPPTAEYIIYVSLVYIFIRWFSFSLSTKKKSYFKVKLHVNQTIKQRHKS